MQNEETEVKVRLNKMAAPNMATDWLEADGLIMIESWARDGYTVEDIADRVGVSASTFRSWMSKYPEIKKAVNNGRELVDYKVENALLKAALGYKTKEVRIATTVRNGKTIETIHEEIDREIAPNVSACQTWLYNRLPKKWRNMNSRANILDELDEDTSISITVERANGPQTSNGGPEKQEDAEWQSEVNKSVTIRGMTEQERAEAQKRATKVKKEQAGEKENFLQMLHSGGTSKTGKKKQSMHSSTVQTQHNTGTKKAAAANDVDYWPDDWDEEQW